MKLPSSWFFLVASNIYWLTTLLRSRARACVSFGAARARHSCNLLANMSSTEFACGVRTSNFTYDKPAALLHSLQDFLWFLRTKSSVFCKSNESGINRSEISRKNFISLFSSFMSNLLWDAKDESGKPGFMFHFGASTKIITSSGRLIPLSRATSHADARICLSCLFVSLFFLPRSNPLHF